MPPTAAVYFDAALIAKFYVNEPGRDAVRRLARQAGTVVTSGIAVAEVAAAFHRKLREGSIDADSGRSSGQHLPFSSRLAPCSRRWIARCSFGHWTPFI